MLREVTDEMGAPLIKLFNQSVMAGEVQDEWKMYLQSSIRDVGRWQRTTVLCLTSIIYKIMKAAVREISLKRVSCGTVNHSATTNISIQMCGGDIFG